MVKLNVNLAERSYPIYITESYENLKICLHSAKIGNKIVLITDSNVDRLQADDCINALSGSGFEISKYVIKAGEESKNLDTIKDIYKFLIGLKLDRKATLLALGGGVVGDITGFAAATFLRGINFVQIPTTLLAQADSSVGGKVGVDFEGNKNIIGAFCQPKLVYINVNSLKTLPEKDLKSGMAEVVKHGIIKDAEFFEYIDYNVKKIFSFDSDVLTFLSKTNCSIKASIVEEDEKENGIRVFLNFGHTIGHAVESFSNFKLTHGECVSIGMVGAMKLAHHYEMVNEETVHCVIELLRKIGLPTRYEEMDVDAVYDRMFYDKKIKDGKLFFILPKSIGEVIECSISDEKLLKSVLNELK